MSAQGLWRSVGAALLAAGAGLAVAPAASQEAGDRATGWWQRGNPGGGAPGAPPPPAPVVPPGGMVVALAAHEPLDGGGPVAPDSPDDVVRPVAIAAVRIPTGLYDATASQLTLRLAGGSRATSPSGAPWPIHACPALGSWEPAHGGAWDERPLADCTTARATGTPDGTGTVVRWELPADAQVEPGVIDVVLVPAGSTPFEVRFQPPAADALAVEQPEGPGEPVEECDCEWGPPEPPVEPGVGSAPFDPLFPAGAPVGLSQPTTQAAAPPSTRGERGGPRRLVPLRSVPEPAAVDDRGRRAVAAGLLLSMGAASLWFGGSPSRPARRLGPLAGMAGRSTARADRPAPVRGVGRFARPRSGPPNRL